MRNGRYRLPQGEVPSSHILKFGLADYRHLPAYETFTMHLANAADLPVVEAHLHHIEARWFAEIRRYDRIPDDTGNSDGHAKNLALLHSPQGGVRLVPFYNLICTRAIARIDERLAFDVGGERDPILVTRAHWEALARACDIRPRFLLGLVDEMAGRLREVLAQTREAFDAEAGEYPALQRIEQVIDKQIRRSTRF